MNYSLNQLFLFLIICLGCSSGTNTTQHKLEDISCESLLNHADYHQQLILPQETQIPGTLEECLEELDRILNLYHKKYIHCLSEEELVPKVHYTLGKWIRTHWQLWDRSPLRVDFEKRNIHHVDDMSSIILLTYHRHLNQKPLKIEEQILEYINYWEMNKIE